MREIGFELEGRRWRVRLDEQGEPLDVAYWSEHSFWREWRSVPLETERARNMVRYALAIADVPRVSGDAQKHINRLEGLCLQIQGARLKREFRGFLPEPEREQRELDLMATYRAAIYALRILDRALDTIKADH